MYEGAASPAATVEKSAGCSSVRNMRRNARSCSFGCSFLFFSFEKENILGAGRRFRLVLHDFFFVVVLRFLCR